MLLNKLQTLVEKYETIELVIPVYNEESILESQLTPLLSELPDGFTILIVENGSTDATLSILEKMQLENRCIKITSLQEASYGNAVRHGLESSTAEIVMVDDLDVLDTAFWLSGLTLLDSSAADMIQGSKVLAGKNDKRPFLRRTATRVLTMLLRLLLGFRGTDTHGPKIMRRTSFVPIFPLCGNEPDLYPSELIILAQRMGLSIRELPIKLEEIRDTPLALHKRIPRALRDLVRLRLKLGRK